MSAKLILDFDTRVALQIIRVESTLERGRRDRVSFEYLGDGFPFLERTKAMSLIEEIKQALSLEIRANSQGLEYLEAVLHKKDLALLNSLLEKHIGLAVKESRKGEHLPKGIQELVDSLGGVRNGQSFFYRREGDRVIYAVLWPWQSDPDKITLKSGVSEIGGCHS